VKPWSRIENNLGEIYIIQNDFENKPNTEAKKTDRWLGNLDSNSYENNLKFEKLNRQTDTK